MNKQGQVIVKGLVWQVGGRGAQVKLSKGEYASTIMMLTKKDIFGNWIEHFMCGDQRLVIKWIGSNKYAMTLL